MRSEEQSFSWMSSFHLCEICLSSHQSLKNPILRTFTRNIWILVAEVSENALGTKPSPEIQLLSEVLLLFLPTATGFPAGIGTTETMPDLGCSCCHQFLTTRRNIQGLIWIELDTFLNLSYFSSGKCFYGKEEGEQRSILALFFLFKRIKF